MGREEKIQEIRRFFNDYSPLVNILIGLIDGPEEFANYDAFKATVLANRAAGNDNYLKGRMIDSGNVYEYYPGQGIIYWTASQLNETI